MYLNGAISHPPYDPEPPLTRELRAFLDLVRSGTAGQEQIERVWPLSGRSLPSRILWPIPARQPAFDHAFNGSSVNAFAIR
jgi:hypothetical protein